MGEGGRTMSVQSNEDSRSIKFRVESGGEGNWEVVMMNR